MSIDPPDDFGSERLEADVLSLEDARAERDRAKTPWRALASFVDEIEAHKADPWITLTLADAEIVRVRVGAIVLLVGGPGSGKSTLAANLLYQHAANVGVSIASSIELPGIEWTARTIGHRCDESWIGVLTGAVPLAEMRRVTALERFVVLERDMATLANLRTTIEAMAKAFSGLPILVAVDYVQILENERREGNREERLRVADVVKALDAIARSLGVVILALSQMSTVNAKAARGGEALGNDAGETAAETSAFNRYATVALMIGKKTDPFEDGSRLVELSIGKFRMGEGDRVLPMREWGKSGKWRVEGEAKTAQEVRDGRDVEKVAKRERATAAQIVGILTKSDRPMSRNEVIEGIGGNRKNGFRLIREALVGDEICEVLRTAPGKAKSWLLWTHAKANEAGVPIVTEGVA